MPLSQYCLDKDKQDCEKNNMFYKHGFECCLRWNIALRCPTVKQPHFRLKPNQQPTVLKSVEKTLFIFEIIFCGSNMHHDSRYK